MISAIYYIVELRSVYTFRHNAHVVNDNCQSTGLEPILPVDCSVFIDAMLNFDGCCKSEGYGVSLYKQTFIF